LPVLGAFVPSVEEPSTGVPWMLPDAISWRTSSGVIGQGEPSTRRQSPAGFSLACELVEHAPYRLAPQAFSAAP